MLTRGNLVQPLIDAAGDRARAEADVVEVLHQLLPAWRERFPPGLCWQYVPPRGLEVYDVFCCHDTGAAVATKAAARHLIQRGFVAVRIHDHPADKRMLTCTCPVHEQE